MPEQETHPYIPENYVFPTEPEVIEKLEWFKDQKLALMMHWGPYVQLGIMESWCLVDSDRKWTRPSVDWIDDAAYSGADEFKRQYWALNKAFYPVRFQPEYWASLAADNGFKYCIITTKHHDGFCMYDTKYTDYKITAPDCPFSTNKNSDVIKALFNAFRAKGMGIGAYFSKADWHSEYYWDKLGIGYETTRNPSYDTAADPERWEKFAQFVKNQITEIVRDYGRVDIIWLDAGQVNRHNKQDIHIEDIIAEARKYNPALISADRTVGGPCENYITPEQTVPDSPLGVPWESCISMGSGFSYRFDDSYKSASKCINLLLDIIAKGGNLALNISPAPDGRIPAPAVKIVQSMGEWLRKNGEGVYCTRPIAPYKKDGFVFTQKAAKGEIFAFRLYKEDDRERLGEAVVIPAGVEAVKSVAYLPTGENLSFTVENGDIKLIFPASVKRDNYADGFKITL